MRAPWDYQRYLGRNPERLAELPPDRLAEMNLLRNLEGLPDIAPDDPGPGVGRRQVFRSFDEAEEYVRLIPPNYVTLYPERGGWGARIQRKAA